MKKGFDAERAVERRVGEGQVTGVRFHPTERIAGAGLELAADRELALINIDSGEGHCAVVLVYHRECSAEAAADIDDSLTISQPCHTEQSLIQPRLCSKELRRLGSCCRRLVPVP